MTRGPTHIYQTALNSTESRGPEKTSPEWLWNDIREAWGEIGALGSPPLGFSAV